MSVKRSLLYLLLGLMLVQAFPLAIQAQSDQGIRFTTSPLPVNLSTDPGVAVSTDLRVRNSGNQPEVFKVGLLTFKASGTTGAPLLRERQPGDDFFDWVSFSPQQFPIAPNEWKTVKMTITPPKDAAFGYYYAVTFSRANNGTTQSGQTSLQGSTAILVLLDVRSPNAKREVTIKSFTIDKSWYEFLPVQFSVKLTNSGNVHASPFGTIFISSNNSQVGSLDINPTKGNVLPSSSRVFTASWSAGFPHYQQVENEGKMVVNNQGQPVEELKWDFSHADQLRIGQYKAHLVMAYDNGTRDVPLEATLSFWIIPWRLILIAIAIPVVPALLVYLLMRWRMKRHLPREEWA